MKSAVDIANVLLPIELASQVKVVLWFALVAKVQVSSWLPEKYNAVPRPWTRLTTRPEAKLNGVAPLVSADSNLSG